MSELDIHAVTVVTEDTYLVLIDDVAPMTADEPVAELALDGLGSATQHVVAQLAVGLVVYLHIVVLRLHVVEAVNVDAHLQAAGAVYQVDELGVGALGLVVHDIHA